MGGGEIESGRSGWVNMNEAVFDGVDALASRTGPFSSPSVRETLSS